MISIVQFLLSSFTKVRQHILVLLFSSLLPKTITLDDVTPSDDIIGPFWNIPLEWS